MTASVFLRLAKTLAFTSALFVFFPITGCSGDDGSGSGGSASGGDSNSGGSTATGGDASSGGATGGSDTGGTTASGGDTSTGGQEVFGDRCTEETECPMRGEFAGNCKTNWPGGYCSATCNLFGDCGSGNVCDMGIRSCLKACESDDECREGYYCNDDEKGCLPDFL